MLSNKMKKIFNFTLVATLIMTSIFGSNFSYLKILPTLALEDVNENSNAEEFTSPFINERAAANDVVADSIKILDFNDLTSYPGKENSKIIVFFDGQSGYFKLRDGNRDMSKLQKFKFPFALQKNGKPHPRRSKDLNEYKGVWHGTHWKKVDRTHILLYADDPSKNDNGTTNEPGQYSGKIRFEYARGQQGTRTTQYDLYLYYLKFNNDNQGVRRYIDEEIPKKDELLKNIKLEITAKNPDDKKQQEEMLNTLMDEHKKIVAYQVNGEERINLPETFDTSVLPKGKEFKLILELTNPTNTKQKDGSDQKMEYTVRMLFVDTKTPFKAEIDKKATDTINVINNLNVSEEEKKELVGEIEAKQKEIKDNVDKPEVKHRELDLDPFDGDATQKEAAKKKAKEKRDEISLPFVATANTNLALALVTDSANKKIADIEKDNTLTEGEKDKLKKQVNDALTESKKNIKEQGSESDLVDTTKKNIETIQNIGIEESKKEKNLAKDNLDAKAQTKIEQINNDKSLTKSEKDALISRVNEELNKAKEEVKKATTQDNINSIENNLQTTLDGITHSGPKKKDSVKTAIEEHARQKIIDIKDNKALTKEEKDLAEQKVNEAKTAELQKLANADVDDVTNTNALETIKTAANSEIDKAVNEVPATKKTEAKNKIDEALQKKKEDIENQANLSPDEKNKYKQDVENLATILKKDIDDAENIAQTDLAAKEASAKEEIKNFKTPARDNLLKEIADEITKKEQDIDGNNELSKNEKDAAKKELNDKLTKLTETIKGLTDQSAIEAAKNNTKTEIQKYTKTPSDKQNARAEINAEKDVKLREIKAKLDDGTITKAESDKYVDEVTKAANTAIKSIDDNKNITEEELKTAVDTGKEEINKVKPLGIENAKEAIQDAFDKKKEKIEANDALIREEKDKLIDELEKKANAEKAKLDLLTTQDDINSAKDRITREITNEVETGTAKANAIKEIEAAFAAKKIDIEGNKDLSTKELEDALRDLNTALTNAKKAINEAKGLDEAKLNELKNTEKGKITAINPLPRQKALDELEKYKQQAFDKIDAEDKKKELSFEEKANLKKSVSDKVKEIAEKIKNAASQDAIDSELAKGKTAIESIEIKGTAKNEAITKLQNDAKLRKDKIADNADLTEDEIKTYQGEIDKILETKIKEIQDAENIHQNKLDKIVGDTTKLISEVETPARAKAKGEIAEAFDNKKKNILDNKALTKDEKDKLILELEAKVTAANEEIDKALTQESLTNITNTNKTDIRDKAVTPVAKPAAIKEINDEKDKKISEIEQKLKDGVISQDERNAYVKEAKDLASNAISAIENELNLSEQNLTQQKAEVLENIAKLNPLGRELPKKQLENQAETKRNGILNDNTLTKSEKDVLIEQINRALETAKANVDKVSSQDLINAESDKLAKSLKDIEHQGPKKKDEAKDAIINDARTKIEKIKKDENLTKEEKENAEKTINQAKDEAVQAITDAKIEDDAKLAELKQGGLQAVSDENDKVKPIKKPAAIKAIEDSQRGKLSDIEEKYQAGIISEAEKNKYESAVNDAAKLALDSIRNNPNIEEKTLENTKQMAVTTIGLVNPLGVEKKIKAIDDALTAKINKIRADKNLTHEEKNNEINTLTSEADKVKEALKTKTSQDEIDTASQEIVEKLNNHQTKPSKKNEAIKDIEAKRDAKISEINDKFTAGIITQKEKEDYIKLASDKAKLVIDEINAAEDIKEADLTAKQNDVNDKITKIKTLGFAKAKDAITKAEDDKVRKISKNHDLTGEERNALIDKVREQAEKDRQALDGLDSQEKIDKAKETSVKNLGEIKEEAKAKPMAKDRLSAKAEAKKTTIRSNKDLSEAELAKYLKEVDDELAKILKGIDDAKDISQKGLDELEKTGNENIDGITPLAKQKNIDAINKAKEAKLNHIKSNKDLTVEEKDELEKLLGEETKKIIDNINAKTSQEEINQIALDGVKTIESIKEEAKAKPKATEAIRAEALKLKNLIENNEKLSDDEKNTAKEKLAKLVENEIKNISDNENISQKDLTKAEEDAKQKIRDLKILAKDKAVAELETLLTKKLEDIENDKKTLTALEKANLKKELTDKIELAINSIKSGDKQEEIDKIHAENKDYLNNLSIKGEAKPKAISKINEELAKRKEQIAANKDLTPTEIETYQRELEKLVALKIKDLSDAEDISETDLEQKISDAKKLIRDFETPARAKAKREIAEAFDIKKKKILANNDLTKEEKDKLIFELEPMVSAANEKIDKALTQADVKKISDETKSTITNKEEIAVLKPNAIKAIEEARQEKLAEIEKKFTDGILTVKEKQDMEAKVNEIADTNIKYIRTNDISNADLEQVKDDTIKAIKAVDTVGREKAVTELTELANGYINFIKYEMKHLDRSDEEGFIKGIQDILKVYLDLIAKAGSDEEVQELLNKGKEAMKKVVVEAGILNDVRKPDLPSLPDRNINKEADKKQKDRLPNTGTDGQVGMSVMALGIVLALFMSRRKLD